MDTLSVGHYDSHISTTSVGAYLRQANTGMNLPGDFRQRFRTDTYHSDLKFPPPKAETLQYYWQAPAQLAGTSVQALQNFLHAAGFLASIKNEGLFDYQTQAAVRLFQAYQRIVSGDTDMDIDGMVGPHTQASMDIWKQHAPSNAWTTPSPTDRGKALLELMKQWKANCQQHPPAYVEQVQDASSKGDTQTVNNWQFNEADIHLIGIRNNLDGIKEYPKENDLFLLVIKGKLFVFRGSTVPNNKMVAVKGKDQKGNLVKQAPFLVEGQHHYRISWHKRSSSCKIYQALAPASQGVLVYRDYNGDQVLDAGDTKAGLTPPNGTIHIHWSGRVGNNWSAGCQVIDALRFLRPGDTAPVDCSAYSATTYTGLTAGQGKGAFQILMDLIYAGSQTGLDTLVHYSLIDWTEFERLQQAHPLLSLSDTLKALG